MGGCLQQLSFSVPKRVRSPELSFAGSCFASFLWQQVSKFNDSAEARNSPGLPDATLLHQQRVEKRAAWSFRTSSPGLPAAIFLSEQEELRSPELNFAGGCFASFLWQQVSKFNVSAEARNSPGLPAATLLHQQR